MKTSDKTWIDNSDYETLLRHWRFAAIGDRMFTDETGKYYAQIMFAKRDLLPDNGVSASKNIGWSK